MPDLCPRACRPARPAPLRSSVACAPMPVLVLALLTLAAPSRLAAQDADALDEPPAPRWDHALELGANAGYAQLRWLPPGDDDSVAWIYELQEGRRPEFSEGDRHYEGHHTSSFVSGLEDGSFYFRVRARAPDTDASTATTAITAWSAWSPTVRVDVAHHARALALGLMGLGALVFVATAGFLVAHRNDPIESSAGGER